MPSGKHDGTMRAYTYQAGEGVGDMITTPVHSESITSDSLGEAIEKAKVITKLRPPHDKETVVRIVQDAADEYPLWASSAEDARNA